MSPHRSSIFPITRRAAFAVGALALRLPTRALAQSSPKTLRLGCVGLQPRSSTIYAAFLRGMSGLGYEDGKNFTFDYVQPPSIQEFPDAYAKVVSRGTDVLIANDCWAWGATGHEWVSGIALEKLPDSVPEFIRTPEAAADIAVMGRELDRSRGAGKTHDAERDPGHYINLAEDGAVVGVLPLSKLPTTREEYDTLLREKGFTRYKAGYLPYSIIDGWQQIRKDFPIGEH